MKKNLLLIILSAVATTAAGQQQDTAKSATLAPLEIRAHKSGMTRLGGAENGNQMGQDVLFRAACCNLGESFVNNPSVDVSYSDAAVGVRQIKLLGLSGQYVQMMIENLPCFPGAASLYELGYVPGAWMKSISVSKGASSVKNGYQSTTGQIDVEYIKPDEESGVKVNLYTDSRLKTEASALANIHMGNRLSSELLVHGEKGWMHHDVDGDGWHDSPTVGQIHVQNRWKYAGKRYIFHGGVALLSEQRTGGQLEGVSSNPFNVSLNAKRAEAYMKHALLIDNEHNTNIALVAKASKYILQSEFGRRFFDADQGDLYSGLLFEHKFNDIHQLSTGVTYQAQRENNTLHFRRDSATPWNFTSDTVEHVAGAYAEYTLTPTYRFTLMAGVRADASNLYGSFVTPRLHAKWVPFDRMTLRFSVGKGYRKPYAWAENHHLLASGRKVVTTEDLSMEEAWNSGISAAFSIPIGEKNLKLNGEYYYTHFVDQLVVDYDSDPLQIGIGMLHGKSFSHTAQIDATMAFGDEMELTAALRISDVRCTYGGKLMEKPLTSRYKGLFTSTWKPLMGLWQVDVTLQMNGGGRMPKPYLTDDGIPSWDERFPAYPQLNVQHTRTFRHLSVYVGGENLTNYRQPQLVVNAANPWSDTFEPTMVWGPVHGIMVYAGIRINY